jgi:hypothetical protein
MSLSNPSVKNPATIFLQWRGGAEAVGKDEAGKTIFEGGKLTYYDKDADDGEGANIEVPLPFSFIVLDELITITGFNESTNAGIWSNEVRDTKKGLLVVRTKGRVIAKGTYDQIKDEVKAAGGKFTKSVYIAYKAEGGELTIGHIKIAGSSLSPWFDFQQKFDVQQCAVCIGDEPTLEKKGTNNYFSPVFEGQNLAPTTMEAAKALDRQVQTYLRTYLSIQPDDEPDDYAAAEDADQLVPKTDAEAAAAEEATVEETAPTEPPKAAPEAPALAPAATKSSSKEKINIADVPF